MDKSDMIIRQRPCNNCGQTRTSKRIAFNKILNVEIWKCQTCDSLSKIETLKKEIRNTADYRKVEYGRILKTKPKEVVKM